MSVDSPQLDGISTDIGINRDIFANIFKIKTGSEGAAAAAETGCGG
jgi:hypothetical protein